MDGSRPNTQPLGPDGVEVYRRPVVIDRNFILEQPTLSYPLALVS